MKYISGIYFFLLSSLFSFCQNPSDGLRSVEQGLSSGKSVSDVLTDPSFMHLHSQTAFRELIKRHAKPGKIILVTATEPGQRITVKGKIKGSDNRALANVLIYVYHTDNKGWYSDTAGHVTGMGGDRAHARLFGYLQTNNDGSFEFATIHPQGYPNSNLPQHIHFEVFTSNGENLMVTELLFDEDPRLKGSIRQQMLDEGAIIAANSGNSEKPLYSYQVKTR